MDITNGHQSAELQEILNVAELWSRRARRRTTTSILIASFIGVAWMGYSYLRVSRLNKEAITLSAQIEERKRELARTEALLKQFKQPAEETARYLGYTLHPDAETVTQSLSANLEFERLAASLKSNPPKETIEYFPKHADSDPEKVITSLKALGFVVKKSTPLVPDVATNTLWAGASVPVDHIKLVAYALLRAGVKLKGIFRMSSKKSGYLVQVGALRAIETQPDLTVEDIGKQTDFPVDRY